jgi:hypothetical protein
MRKDRPRLRWGGVVVMAVGIAGALVTAIEFEHRPDVGLFGFPLSVTVAVVGWYTTVWAKPLENPLRRLGRFLRVLGVTISLASAGLYAWAALTAFAEEHLPVALDWLAVVGVILGLPLGLVLVACGLVAGLWGRDQELVSPAADQTPAVIPSAPAN